MKPGHLWESLNDIGIREVVPQQILKNIPLPRQLKTLYSQDDEIYFFSKICKYFYGCCFETGYAADICQCFKGDFNRTIWLRASSVDFNRLKDISLHDLVAFEEEVGTVSLSYSFMNGEKSESINFLIIPALTDNEFEICERICIVQGRYRVVFARKKRKWDFIPSSLGI